MFRYLIPYYGLYLTFKELPGFLSPKTDQEFIYFYLTAWCHAIYLTITICL